MANFGPIASWANSSLLPSHQSLSSLPLPVPTTAGSVSNVCTNSVGTTSTTSSTLSSTPSSSSSTTPTISNSMASLATNQISNNFVNQSTPSATVPPFSFGLSPFGNISAFDGFARMPPTTTGATTVPPINPVNFENFDLKNFDPRAMLNAYFGAFSVGNGSLGLDSSSALFSNSNNPNNLPNLFNSRMNTTLTSSSVSSTSTLSITTKPSNNCGAASNTSIQNNDSTSSSVSNHSPIMSTQSGISSSKLKDSKFSPLNLLTLNEQLEQDRDLLQLHETLNQRFKNNNLLATNPNFFNNRFFPYGFRPFSYNASVGQQPSTSPTLNSMNSINSSGNKLSSPVLSDAEFVSDKKSPLNCSTTSSNCPSPARSSYSGIGGGRSVGTRSATSTPDSIGGNGRNGNNNLRSSSPQPSPKSMRSLEDRSPKSCSVKNNSNSNQSKQSKSSIKESLQELKHMQLMVEGLDGSTNTNSQRNCATSNGQSIAAS
ncbi:hypothetical protein SSS_06541 [Sarcoptes scabiei]|nr:hypothetical protein SSS_06541 [Sarcoptes scabiei]